MKKHLEIEIQTSTLNKCSSNEMLFILRAQDYTSPEIICEWIKQNIQTCENTNKLREALECAIDMREHETRKNAD